MQKLRHFVITLITKDYLRYLLETCLLSKELSILSRETIQDAFFFFVIVSLFRLGIVIHYQAPHRQALATACHALVVRIYVKIMGWL